MMKVLVLGATGMLGNAVFRVFAQSENHEVIGTARSKSACEYFSTPERTQILQGIDVGDGDSLVAAFAQSSPDVVINCIGLVKQLAESYDPLLTVPINTLLPHRLARLCQVRGARLVHISTDCVFSGKKGGYLESDFPDADDLYGRTKLLGEVDYPEAITLRTSIIGHELSGNRSLINWFLSQEESVKGFTKAVFSGLPTVVLARIIKDYVLPKPALHGLFHVAAAPINKYELLRQVADVYGKKIDIVPNDSLVIDRSLNSEKFNVAFNYSPPKWPELINEMYQFK
jgi:dTDP-4-dehydrorhamnose reductase